LLAALKLDPESAGTHYQLGEAMVAQGKPDEAVNYYRQALQVEPDNILFLRKLAGVLKSKGRFEEAIEHYQQALKSKPDSIELKEDLGMIMIKAGRPEEMLRLSREILLMKPDYIHALNNLAWVLATNPGFGQAEEALHLASRACELTKHQNVTFLDTLAAAYANTGQFDRAVETAQKAVDLATAARDDNAADQIKNHLELYKQSQPCREP
jgi:tetratricopeptide (TPR) repeat protein